MTTYKNLEQVFQCLKQAGLKINTNKSVFGKPELEYLGYWITREGIQPITKKVKAIQNIAAPTNQWQVRRFVAMVNFYRDMWLKRLDILAPLTKLTAKTAKWNWTQECQNSFDKMKQTMQKDKFQVYPNFNEEFTIHTDASHTQLGVVIARQG